MSEETKKQIAELKDLGVVGKKIGMTQVFDAEGDVVPVTVIQIAENIVSSIKTKDKHGYDAIQVANFACKEKAITKAEKGHLAKEKLPTLKQLQEFRLEAPATAAPGDALDVEEFFKGVTKLNIRGKSVGKGFQSGIKRYNMKVGRNSHGSKSKRIIGSIGSGTTPGRVYPGKRMPGNMGNEMVTIAKAKFVSYDPETRVLLLRGPVQGKTGSIVTVTAFGLKKWNHNNK